MAKLTKSEQTLAELLHSAAWESERGHVLVCHAFLDNGLKRLLESYFRSNGTREDTIDWLLTKRPEPPLQSFFRRATVAYACGLIMATTYDALRAVNDLRIKAAHSPDLFRLNERNVSSIVDRLDRDTAKVMRLRASNVIESWSRVTIHDPSRVAPPPSEAKAMFEAVFFYLNGEIGGAVDRLNPRNPGTT